MNRKPWSRKQRLLLWWIPRLVALFLRFLGLTLRRSIHGAEHMENLQKSGKPFILALWHTNVFFATYLYRNRDLRVMISASLDGELIARVVHLLGNGSIRGSTSRGGLQAVKEALQALKNGCVAITPDGPKGPAFCVQSGVITLAQKSGAPILPCHFEASNQWIATKSWDLHRIPKPFAKLFVRIDEPIFVPPVLDAKEFDVAIVRVQSAMQENMLRCQEMASS